MVDVESDEHLKIFKCLVDTGADVLRSAVERKLFNNNAITFDDYLQRSKHQLYHQFERDKRKPCCYGKPHNCVVNGNMDRKIFNKVYKNTAASDKQYCLDRFEVTTGISTDDLDLSDLYFFLYNSKALSQNEETTLKKIMSIRSSICHAKSSRCYSMDALESLWLSLEQAVVLFAEPYRYKKMVTLQIKTSRASKVNDKELQRIINQMRTESEKTCHELQVTQHDQTDGITKSVTEEVEELKKCIVDANVQTQSNMEELTANMYGMKTQLTTMHHMITSLIGVIGKQKVELAINLEEMKPLDTIPDTPEISFTSKVNQTNITEETEDKVIANLPSEIEIPTERPLEESGIEKIEITAKKVNSIILEIKATPGIFKSVNMLKLAILTLVNTIQTAGDIDVNVENIITVCIKFESLTKDQIDVVKCLFTNEWNYDKIDTPLSYEYQYTEEGTTMNRSLVVANNSQHGILKTVPSESFEHFTRAPCQSCEEKDKQIKALEEKNREHELTMDRFTLPDASPVADERTPRMPGHSVPVSMSTKEFDSNNYKIKSGLVLVLNNSEFNVRNKPLADRIGSDIDVRSISQQFLDLGFKYEVQIDLTKSETFKWFRKVKEDLITKPVDCFVLVLLSHGAENGVYATDELISIEDIEQTFSSKMCPALRFKPKIVIMQSCRGSHLSGIKPILQSNQADTSVDQREYTYYHDDGKPIRLPNQADFLFAYATVPGSGSFRNVHDGTPFIQHLSIALRDMKENEDFYSVLTSVNKAVGITYKPYEGNTRYNEVLQMPCFVSHLTKSVRLKQSH